VPVLGRYEQVRKVLALCGASQVVLALPREIRTGSKRCSTNSTTNWSICASCRTCCTSRPCAAASRLRRAAGDQPARQPLVGWAAIQKRVFDIAASRVLLAVASPFLGALALAVRFTCGAPVLYVQDRMGLDGRVFRMVKFRTMVPDAESGGPVWACTAIRGRRGSAASCGAPASTSCRSSGTCCVVT